MSLFSVTAGIRNKIWSVLSNTGAGWGYEMTPAELTRKDEFYSIYWKEYNAVKNGMNSELKELPDYLEKLSLIHIYGWF